MDVNIRSVSEGNYPVIKDDFNEYFAYKKDLKLGLQIGNKVRLKFDYAGFVAAVETAGNTVNYEYDGTYATNFAEFTLTYEYDDLGNIETITNSANPSDNRAYSYDLAGIRDSKTVDGVTYHYDTLNGKVVRQTWTENGDEHVFDIVYDASGLPYACVYDGSRFYYVLNQQGDVIRIVGYLGATLCEYQYDAWGNVLAITGIYKDTIGKINPIRYRGYYYDAETGFYYLQSRYYDPSIGRFINADSFASTGQDFLGCNMLAYCLNNPTRYVDINGAAAVDIFTEDGEIFDASDLVDRGGGGSSWHVFISTIDSLASGFNMAMGSRKSYPHPEIHHVVPHENKTHTPTYEGIVVQYDFSLERS